MTNDQKYTLTTKFIFDQKTKNGFKNSVGKWFTFLLVSYFPSDLLMCVILHILISFIAQLLFALSSYGLHLDDAVDVS